MSVVTGLTLITGVLDEKIADEFRIVLQGMHTGWSISGDLSEHSGGSKGPQCCIYSGGLNYLGGPDQRQMLDWLYRQCWYSPGEVCVVFNYEEAYLEIYRMDGQRITNDD